MTVFGSNDSINIAAASDTVILQGMNDAVSFGANGSLNLTASQASLAITGSNDVVSVTGTDDQITFSASNTTLSLTDPGNTINLTGNTDIIALVASSDVVNLAGSNDKVSITGSSNTVGVAGANNTIALTGSNNTILYSQSNDSFGITGSGGAISINDTVNNDAVTLGGGNTLLIQANYESVNFSASGATLNVTDLFYDFNFSLNGQNDTVTVQTTYETINVNGSNDSIVVAGLEDVLDVSGSNDTATIGPDVYEFNTVNDSGANDTINLNGSSSSVNVSGADDTVVAEATANNTVNISASNTTTTVTALYDAINLSGSNDTDNFLIESGSVAVSGNSDVVTISGNNPGWPALNVNITGSGDTVTFEGSSSSFNVAANNANINFAGNNDTATVAGSGDTLIMSGVDDDAALTGSNNTILYSQSNDSFGITGSGGAISINDTVNNDAVTLGGGNTLLIQANYESVNFSASGATLNVTDFFYDFNFSLNGQNDTVTVQTTYETINVNGSNDSIVVAGLEDVLDVSGSNDTATIGPDVYEFNTVNDSGANDTINLNGSSSSVNVSGADDTVVAEATANNTVNISASNTTTTVTALYDAINLSGSNDTDNFLIESGSVAVSGNSDVVTISGNNPGWPALNVNITGSGDTVTFEGSSSSFNVAANNANINFAGNNDTAAVTGSGDNINVSGTNDVVTVAGNGAAVTVSGSGNALNVAGTGDAVNFNDTNASLTLVANGVFVQINGYQNADDVMGITGSNDTIANYGWNNSLSVTGSSNSVAVDGNYDLVNLTGAGNTVTTNSDFSTLNIVGDGADVTVNSYSYNDAINLTGNSETASINGNGDVVTVSGTNDSIALNGGGETLVLVSDNSSLSLTASNETIDIAGANNVVTITGNNNAVNVSGANDSVIFQGSGTGNIVTATGPITGSANGIDLVQNGAGDLTIDAAGGIVGDAGNGVIVEQSASGTGNIFVDDTGSVTGTGTGSIGLLAENLNSADSGNITITQLGGVVGGSYGIEVLNDGSGNIAVESAGAVSAGVQYGIFARSYGTGDISIVTDPGSIISSGGSGIVANNRDTSIAASADSAIMITADGIINAGSNVNLSGSPSAGIIAGYNGTNVGFGSVANTSVNGTVIVNNNANVTDTGGYGVEAFNFGNGDVTVNDGSGTSVSGTEYGIAAVAESHGTGSSTVNVAANATISAGTIYAIQVLSYDVGSVNVTTSAGDVISSGGAGVVASDQAASIAASANSSVTVTAYGTINSGPDLNVNGSVPQGIAAGYLPGGNQAANVQVTGTVVVDNHANITAAGYGIDAYNWGNGSVTLIDEAGTSVSGGQYGIAAFGLSYGTGNVAVSVLANATITAGTLYGIEAVDKDVGNVSVTTGDGDIITSGNNGILALDEATSISSAYSVNLNVGADTISAGSGGGINAGYYPGSNSIAPNVHGNVTVDSNATITTASSYGINAFNWGTGNVTVSTGADSSINAAGNGINAIANDGGNVSVTVGGTVNGANALDAVANGAGSVTIVNDGEITSNIYAGIGVTQNSAGATGSTTITNNGTVLGAVDSQAIYDLESSAGTVTINNSGVLGTSGLSASTQVIAESGGDITINNTGTINGTIDDGNGTFDNEAGGTWQVAGWSGFGFQSSTGVVEANTINNAGTINMIDSAYLAGANGLIVSNTGTIDNLSGYDTIDGAVSNAGTIEVIGGTLNLAGGLTETGTLIVDNGGTLELAGAGAETITFSGGSDTLQLDNALGFTGTISGASSTGGTFAISGYGVVTATSGDAIDFTASGGVAGNAGNVVLTPDGTITGAANGIELIQNGFGDLTIDLSGNIAGQAGDGIIADQSASGTGNIFVDNTGSVTGTGTGSIGLLAEILNSADIGNITIRQFGGVSGTQDGIEAITYGTGNISIESAGAVTAGVQFGIRAASYGTGDISVVTDIGSSISSGGTGINAASYDTAISASANSTITVTNNGTIANFGTTLNPSGSLPQGITAGYYGANGTVDTQINGAVVINNNGNVTVADSYGLEGYNWGNGDVTVNDGSGTSVSGGQYGIAALGLSYGTGDIAVSVSANATITAGTLYGIEAVDKDVGNVSVTAGDGDVITSGNNGVLAFNEATSISSAYSVNVNVGDDKFTAGSNGGINAGYYPGSNTIAPNVHGDVTVNSDATIATGPNGYGISAFNWGTGDVTVETGVSSSIAASGSGNGIQANAFDGGNVSVTNDGILSGATGLYVAAVSGGNISVENAGQITGNNFSGINVNENGNGSMGSTTIDNTGIVLGSTANAAISVSENATGTVTIDNEGIIGPSEISASTQAIYESGGAIVINNAGEINGNVDTTTTGFFGSNSTFNNEAGASWLTNYIGDDGTITATGAGSNIKILGASNGIDVGSSANGVLTVEAGASLTGDYLDIGDLVGSTGTVLVAGAGTSVNTTAGEYQNILVGFDGTASLTIADHAVVTTTNLNSAIDYQAGITDVIDVNDATLIATQNLSIAGAGTANVTVENDGAITGGYFNIGSVAGGTGSLTAAGAGSTVIATDFLGIGSSQSSGSLTVTGGASALSDGGIDDEGIITASGVGSAITVIGSSDGINVGYSDTGFLTLEAGATLTSDFLNIAQLVGSTGTVDVTGAGTTLDATSGDYQGIAVGFDGTASLAIADHAIVTTTNMDVAVNFDLGVTDSLDISNASLIAIQNLTIADAGTANATVENGGTIDTNFLSIANQAGSTGSLTVDGAGSVVSIGSGLNFGMDGGTADLTVTHGGAVDVGSDATTIAGAVHVGSLDSLQGAGTINSALVDDGNVTAVSASGVELVVTGAVTGSGDLSVANGAHLEFGSSVASSDTIVFQGSTGSLIVDQSSGFAGLISGFTGDGTLSGSDQIDLKDINYNSGSFTETFNPTQDTVSLSDGTHSAVLQFLGNYVAQNFSFTSDGSNGTIIYDPPVSAKSHDEVGSNSTVSGIAPASELASPLVTWTSDGFKFANLGSSNSADLHLNDLSVLSGQPFAAANFGHADHEGPAGWDVLLEGHNLGMLTSTANAELNLTHFHLL